MKDLKQELSLPLVDPSAPSPPAKARGRPTLASAARRTAAAALTIAALLRASTHLSSLPSLSRTAPHGINWKPCGTGLQCTTISVPLDWHNASDPRTVKISVNKKPADPTKERLGSIFVNPGGPGGSGTNYVHRAGAQLTGLSGGQYDIIGFDPRGINETRPYVSCFDSALDEHLYQLTAPLALDLPVNFSSVHSSSLSSPNPAAIVHHLEAQVRVAEASFGALYAQCAAKSGDSIDFVGTEFVVRDIDHMSKLLEGPEAPINFWGLSYGTIVGQYLVAILPAERIGRVIIDGVVDWESWSRHTTKDFDDLRDIDRVFEAFANACADAGEACALSSLGSGAAILSAIDGLIDTLYHEPAPMTSVPNVPGLLIRSTHARQALFKSAYSIKLWPALGSTFAEALKGNYTQLLTGPWGAYANLTTSYEQAAKDHDSSRESTAAIRCADQPAYTADDPAPTTEQITAQLLDGIERDSARAVDMIFGLMWCKLWKGEKKSYYSGNFTLKEGTLKTPVLVLSQTYDPVTPLDSAERAIANWGYSNARLVEQNGTGHCTIGQASLATAKILRKYWLEGEAPEAGYTHTEVDEHAFQPQNTSLVEALSVDDRELLEAWSGLGEAVLGMWNA